MKTHRICCRNKHTGYSDCGDFMEEFIARAWIEKSQFEHSKEFDFWLEVRDDEPSQKSDK